MQIAKADVGQTEWRIDRPADTKATDSPIVLFMGLPATLCHAVGKELTGFMFTCTDDFEPVLGTSPDVIVVSLDHLTHPTDAIRTLRSKHPATEIIALSSESDYRLVVAVMQAGAGDFQVQPIEPAPLLASIRAALLRAGHWGPTIGRTDANVHCIHSLSTGELCVLRLLMEGLQNKQIAASLDVSVRTVELRRASIMRKTNAKSLFELVQLVTTWQQTLHSRYASLVTR